MSRETIRERSVFLLCGVLRVLSFFGCFSFHWSSARYSFFCLKIVAFFLCVPCYLSGLNMHFSPFSVLGTCNFVITSTGTGQTPEPFLVSRHSPFSGSCPPVGLLWEARMWSVAGARGTGECSRLGPPVPGPHGGSCSVSQSDATCERVW